MKCRREMCKERGIPAELGYCCFQCRDADRPKWYAGFPVIVFVNRPWLVYGHHAVDLTRMRKQKHLFRALDGVPDDVTVDARREPGGARYVCA